MRVALATALYRRPDLLILDEVKFFTLKTIFFRLAFHDIFSLLQQLYDENSYNIV